MMPQLAAAQGQILPRNQTRVKPRKTRVTDEPSAVPNHRGRPCAVFLKPLAVSVVDGGYRRLTNSVFTSPFAEMECMAKPRGALDE